VTAFPTGSPGAPDPPDHAPITFVTPRYGPEVLGGAEAGARLLATGLAADGRDVAVITSCAVSMKTWADHYLPGTTVEEGVTVTRCPVDRPRAPDFDARSDRLLPRARHATVREAEEWIDQQGPTSAALIEAVRAVDRGVNVFYPYLYHPTVRGIAISSVPSVLYPAAHHELPLELPVFDEVFERADGLAFHTQAEQTLVHDRFPATRRSVQAMVGLPVEAEGPGDPDRSRIELGLGDEPFVLCLGRIDRGKGTHDLVERFARWRAGRGSGLLVLAGPIAEPVPDTEGVLCLGPVPHEHKAGLLAAADVLINPSFYESFSLVMLEAWLAGTPVLVNGWCAPLIEHCVRSGGGLAYTGLADFELALSRLVDDPAVRRRLATAGERYVRSSYSWPAVRGRLDALTDRVSAR
jgi:glycosyltransferase involved in cell wall biosynthesis